MGRSEHKGSCSSRHWSLGSLLCKMQKKHSLPVEGYKSRIISGCETSTQSIRESSVIRAGLKGNPGEQTENKTQSSFSLESLFYSVHPARPEQHCQKPGWPEPPAELSPGRHRAQKPSAQTRKAWQIFRKTKSECNNRKHPVNSAIADTTHSAYNSAMSPDKPPASSCPHGDSLRRPQERTALLCSGESVKFIICLLFFAFPFPLTSD